VNQFILQTLRKFDKLTHGQAREILAHAVDEIDRLETVLDSLYTGVLVSDETHNLLLTNKALRRLLKVKRFEMGSVVAWAALEDESIADFLRKTLVAGDRVEGREFETESRLGTRRLLSFDVLPLVKLYHVTGAVVLVRDITKKRAREAKLRRAESLASLTTLAAGVAHEIKNPLASISIHIQLIQKMLEKTRIEYPTESSALPFEKINGHFDIVTEEIDRLNFIVVDFLFAVRPMDLTLRKGDINDLIKGIVRFLSLEMSERHIACVTDFAKDIPLFEFDERYMKEAILNLAKNAIEAMRQGGGTLTIRTERADADIIISISDTGEGISQENQAKIFEPYWTTKETGTGLGLTLVFKIVREHRGEIAVHSELGAGSAFVITLPLPQTERRLLRYSGDTRHELQNTDS
jgi:signal transduction histidine kinase